MRPTDILKTFFENQNKIQSALLEPEKQLFQQVVDKFVGLNNEIRQTTDVGFMFNGYFYLKKGNKPLAASEYSPALDITLCDEFETSLKHLKKCEKEVQFIWQALLPLIEKTNYDYRNALPEEMAMLPIFPAGSARTVAHEEVLKMLTPFELKQYQEVLPRIQYYVTLRMVS